MILECALPDWKSQVQVAKSFAAIEVATTFDDLHAIFAKVFPTVVNGRLNGVVPVN